MVEDRKIIKELYFDEEKDCYIEEVETMIDGKKFTVINEFPKDGPSLKEQLIKLIKTY